MLAKGGPPAPSGAHVPRVASHALNATMATSGKPSLNKFALMRLMTVERATGQMKAVVEKTKAEIEVKMKSSSVDTLEIERQLELKRLKNDMFKEYRETLRGTITRSKETAKKIEQECAEKRDRLKSLHDELEKKKKNLENQRQNYQERRENYLKINALLLLRRKQLINEISNIYPVEDRLEPKTDRPLFSIFGFVVPNADDISAIKSADEEKVATGLGYTAHILLMISQFLDMPLRFPIIHCGSRSRIHDHITKELLDRDRDFPLHSKGKEKFLFNYGVFLLNKNIAQLRHYCGLSTQDLRNTLPNLHSLLEQRLGVQLGNKAPVRSGAGLHTLPSTSRQIVQANNLVGVFQEQADPSMDGSPCEKPIDDSRLHPAIPASLDSSSDIEPMQGTRALENSVSERETAPANESERDKESDADADVDGEGEREKWLRRNPKMAAFIGDSSQGPINSEDEGESDGRRSNSVASENPRSRAGTQKQDAEEMTTPTAETRDLENVPPTSNGTSVIQVAATDGANDSNDARDKEKPTSDPSVPTAVDSVDETSSTTTTKDASDIPKGLQDSSQSKAKTANQKPAGLSAAALKSVPRGLSRGNARNASSTFHASKKQQQSASKLIADTFAKHKSDGSNQGDKKDLQSQDQTQSSLLTNTNFNLVDRSKCVISDD